MRSAILMALVASFALAACSGESRDWRSAEAADTVEAYDHFVDKHPDSEHAAQARTRLAQLGEDREWQRASTADTAAAYREFLVQHPNGKWAGEARIRVENFALAEATAAAPAAAEAAPVSPSSSPGPSPAAPSPASSGDGFGIQLGAFSSEAAAHAEWQKLQARHPPQLGGLEPQVQQGASSTGTVFRLQAPVGAEDRARGICSALVQASQPCVVVLPPR
jgi:hypothetical protein